MSTLASCALEVDTDDTSDEDETLGVVKQALDSAHTRVIQECSHAMSGSWWTYNTTNWPTGTTYGTYAYTSADAGAWNLLLNNAGGYAANGTYYTGFYASCMRYRSQGYLPAPLHVLSSVALNGLWLLRAA